jgi:hypothetical protein
MRAEWWEIKNSGLAPDRVAALVHHAGMALLSMVSIRCDASFVVLRGGRLLESCLDAHGYRPGAIKAKRGERSLVPPIPDGAATLLVCDTLSDTGETLLECVRSIHARRSDAVIHICCPFMTAEAITLLRPMCGALHTLEVFGHGSAVLTPRDIPYDFGDIAERIFGAAIPGRA